MPITASSFNSTSLNTTASVAAILYQRNATNPLNGSLSTAIPLGTLTTDQSQLDVTGQVSSANQSGYYSFNLQGSSLKIGLTNLTNSADLRVQLYDSTGTLVADNQGTPAQQTAYTEATLTTGLTATPGQYSVQVSYAPATLKSIPQSYSLSLYSGTGFNAAYQTTAASQLSPTTYVPIDNTLTFQTSDAQLYSRSAYNKIGATASTGVNIGWLYENQSALSVQSQLTSADSTEFYSVALQQGSNLKLAFNNTTPGATATGLRVQLYDPTGTVLLADSNGTTAQQAAYAQLTSSTGLAAKPGNFSIKVSYAPNANKSETQNYNFQLYSGSTYSSQYTTTASAQTYGNAILSGNPAVIGYSTAGGIASYVQNFANGVDPQSTLFTALAAFV